MILRLLFTVIFSLGILPFAWSAGNGWVSSGGDNHPETAAWFISAEKIKVCVERAYNYPKTESELQSMIQKASAIWKNYYFTKIIPGNSNRSVHPQFDFSFSSCSNETEVIFYFDVENNEVKSEKDKYYDPIAFATLQKLNFQSGRGKGFLWFANLNALDPALNREATQGIILHELGHVYGNSHFPDTIMDEKIAEAIAFTGVQGGYQVDNPGIMSMMNSIDWKRPLYFDFQSLWNYQGHVPFDQLNPRIKNTQRDIVNGHTDQG